MRARHAAPLAALGLLLATGARAEEKPVSLSWQSEGYVTLLDAAAAAKPQDQRILIGLSGSPT